MKEMEEFVKNLQNCLKGTALSQAILEDYCNVISKIEHQSSETVKTRILERSEELYKNLFTGQKI